MANDLPAYDANPEGLQEVCEVLREGGLEESELHEVIEDRSGDSINKNVSYGVKLGFLSRGEDGVEATKRGQTYGYGNLPDDREISMFREGIKEYSFYNELLKIARNEIQEINDSPSIVRDGITREIRINFDFEAGDRVLESAAGTFLNTLDAAGLGQYKRSNGTYPTRLEINDEFENYEYEKLEPTEGDADDQEGKEDEEESDDDYNNRPKSNNQNNGIGDITDVGNNGENKHSAEPEPTSPQTKSKDPEINIDIQIEISSGDWDLEDVRSLINDIQNTDASTDLIHRSTSSNSQD